MNEQNENIEKVLEVECWYCHQKINEKEKFCRFCGKKQSRKTLANGLNMLGLLIIIFTIVGCIYFYIHGFRFLDAVVGWVAVFTFSLFTYPIWVLGICLYIENDIFYNLSNMDKFINKYKIIKKIGLIILIINVVGCLILFKAESQELAKNVVYENLSVIFNNPLFILGILLYLLSGHKIKKLQKIVDIDNKK